MLHTTGLSGSDVHKVHSMAATVALTGATGFVGGHILTALLAAGHEVRALCRRPEALGPSDGLTVVAGDLGDRGALEALLEQSDLVVHCAGLLQAAARSDFQAVNVGGTAGLLEAVLARTRSPAFLLISSMAAREPRLSFYAESKRDAEALLRVADARLSWQVLRPPAVYGPGDRATLPFFQQSIAGRLFVPAGKKNRFSLIDVEDLAEAVAFLAAQGLLPGAINELHDGRTEGYNWSEFAESAGTLVGRRVATMGLPRLPLSLFATVHCTWSRLLGRKPMVTPGKINELFHPDWVARENLLDRVSDWRPRTGLEEGFEKALAWYKANGWL